MKTAQYKWSQNDGWRPNLPTGEVGRQSVVFVFGARSLMQAGDLVGELRDHFKEAAMLGCSTSGEIHGDMVVDDSVTATIVDFEHTRIRIKSAHKSPEPVVIDTSLPTIVPPPLPALAKAPVQPPA